ncbi:alpha-hydroxy acid oxidase [Methylophilus sp. TWE2]|uniref:alpha-hydroxy acid oxidase n=1 Tax=Methylophilus sp. TWE2 TaxID=1662285 RepID=UPI00067080B9|nr:alpha-hydroxy acid oxidase [Methylophilus sp. TWE2]AKR44080.1 2-hydroxy-acid oxidase [Methylophilus sp. TWE2]
MQSLPLLPFFAQQAQTKLPANIWHYLQSDAGLGAQLQSNEAGWQAKKLLPRPLQALHLPSTQCELFGEQWAHPIMLAPVAYQKLFHPDGEIGTAVACNAQQGQMMVSSLASQPVEEIIKQAQQPLWFQLYWQGSREATAVLLNKALAAGASAIIFTVDAPVKQALIDLPAGVSAVNLAQPLTMQPIKPGQSQVFDGWMTQAPTWEDVAWLRQQMKIPLLIKGLMHAEDAKRAVTLGCEGIVVSNHGGRVLDSTPSVAAVLPQMVAAVGGQCKILVDSGIRSGQDIFKALAMGADAVCVGRPYVWGLAAEGAMGVAKVIRYLRDELEMTMALTGVSTLAEIRQVELYA